MRYMVIERFVRGAPGVRTRSDDGAITTAGTALLRQLVSESLDRCFRLMETDDPRLLDEWMKQWSDLVVFEDVVPVATSAEAASRALPGSLM